MTVDVLITVLEDILAPSDVAYQHLPPDVRISRRDGKLFVFNYNAEKSVLGYMSVMGRK